MKRRLEKNGWNDRYGDKRFTGEEGVIGANSFPQTRIPTIAAADPAGNYDGSDTIPTDSVCAGVTIEVTEIFDNTPTLTVGTVATPDLLVDIADAVDLTALGETYIAGPTTWDADSVVRAVIGGTPTQGACTVTPEFEV